MGYCLCNVFIRYEVMINDCLSTTYIYKLRICVYELVIPWIVFISSVI